MKKIIFSVLFFCFITAGFAFGSVDLAGKYYTQKKYQAALQEYLSLPKNADVYYNIGNCYYRLGELGKAVLYYHRAVRLSPGSWQIEKNLQIVEKSLLDKPAKLTAIEKAWVKVVRFLSLNFLAIALLSGFVLFGLLWILSVYRPRSVYFAVFVLLLCFVLGFFTYHQHRAMSRQAVLMAEQAVGYSGPSGDNKQVFTIHQGNKFSVLQQENDWSKIKLEQGFVGWIKSKSLEKI